MNNPDNKVLQERYKIFFKYNNLEQPMDFILKEEYESVIRVCFYFGSPIIGKYSSINNNYLIKKK